LPKIRPIRIIDKEGNIKWLELNAVMIEWEGKPATLNFLNDITDRKRAEEALRESEAQSRAILNAIPDLIFQINKDGIFLNYKGTREELYASPDEFLGKDVRDVLPTELAKQTMLSAERALQSGEIQIFEYHLPMGSDLLQYEARIVSIDEDEVLVIARNITERKRAEERQNTMSEGMRAVVEVADELITCPDMDTLLRRAVELAKDKLGLERCAIFLAECDQMVGAYGTDRYGQTTDEHANQFFVGENWFDFWKERAQSLSLSDLRWYVFEDAHLEWDGEKAVTIGEGWIAATLIQSSEGPSGIFYNDTAISGTPFNEAKQEVVAVFCSLLGSIIERKRAEEKIKTALEEREVLLREIHHRVKNNLQIISSLLKLQSRYIEDEKYSGIFQESQDRIRSMALIHDRLYHSENLANIDFKDYIRNLASNLFHTYKASAGKIELKIDVEDVSLGIDTAIPCGLIINELVSNSLKHAFPDGREGEIKIILSSTDENEVELIVSDDGVGIPEELDFRNTASLGLQLVVALVEQLQGEIELNRAKGTEFRIKFKF